MGSDQLFDGELYRSNIARLKVDLTPFMLVNRVAYEEGRELADMQREFDLHPLAVEDAQHGHQRPKIEEYGDSLFVAMHIVEPGEELKVGEMAIFVGRNYVLSVRQHAERAFTDLRARCEREPELLRHGSGYVLYALMDAVVDRYFPVLDTLEMELETIEEKIFAAKSARAIIESLYYVKQRSE